MATEGEAVRDDEPPAKKAAWAKILVPILLPVLAAILVTAFTPVGEKLRSALFPTSGTVRATIKLAGKPLAGANVAIDGKSAATSDDAGAFSATKVKQGQHALVVTALGAKERRIDFDVKRSEGLDLGTVDVIPSLRLAVEGSGGLDPTFDEGVRAKIKYDVTMWLEGDKDVLDRVTKVAYTLPTRVQASPAVVTSKTSRFCFHYRLVGSITLNMGETLDATPVAVVTFADGKTLSLSPPDGPLPPGQRPSGCR